MDSSNTALVPFLLQYYWLKRKTTRGVSVWIIITSMLLQLSTSILSPIIDELMDELYGAC